MDGDSRELVERAARGDREAVGDLLEAHLPRLEAYVQLRMGRELSAKESVSDLVQSVCHEILGHMDRFRYHGEQAFRRWLYTTAQRKIANKVRHYRAARRDVNREQVSSPDLSRSDAYLAHLCRSIDSPSGRLALREQVERLQGAFEKLPEHYREVISLARIVGLSHREIGEEMGRTENASRLLLSRALVALSKELGPDV